MDAPDPPAGLSNLTRGTVLATRLEVARTARAQLRGLMGREHLAHGSAFVLPGTRGVHTHFMRFPIDVVFYDRDRVVVGVEHALRPWRLSAYHVRARGAVEAPAGTARTTGTEVGDRLRFAEAPSAVGAGTHGGRDQRSMRERVAGAFTWKRACTYAVPLALLYVVAWVVVALNGRPPLNSSDQPLGGDYIAFYAAGRLILEGQGQLLYDRDHIVGVQDRALGGVLPDFYDAYRNPPFFALPFAALATLALLPSALAYSVLSAGCLALALWLATGLVPGLRARWRGLAVLVFAFGPVYYGLIDGQNATISLLLYVLIYRAIARGREQEAGAWAALGLFKPQLFLVFPIIFAASRRWGALAAYAATAACLAALSVALVGLDGTLGWLRILLDMERGNAASNAARMHSLKAFFDLLLPDAAPLAMGLALLATLALLVPLARAWAPADAWRTQLPLRWAFTSLVAVLVDPHLVDYDLTVLVLAGVLAIPLVPWARWWALSFYALLLARELVPVGAGSIQLTVPVLLAGAWGVWRQLAGAATTRPVSYEPAESCSPRAAVVGST